MQKNTGQFEHHILNEYVVQKINSCIKRNNMRRKVRERGKGMKSERM